MDTDGKTPKTEVAKVAEATKTSDTATAAKLDAGKPAEVKAETAPAPEKVAEKPAQTFTEAQKDVENDKAPESEASLEKIENAATVATAGPVAHQPDAAQNALNQAAGAQVVNNALATAKGVSTEPAEKTEEERNAEELEVLKARADMMGIGYSNNIGVETLRKKISDKLNGEAASNGADDAEQTQEEVDELIQDNLKAQVRVDPTDPKAGDQTVRSALAPKFKDKRQEMHDEYMRLIRCRITNMDPKKKDLQGEIFTVANEMLGTVKKFIPYGEFSDNGYHIPYWLFLEISDRRFLNIRTSKDKASGQIKVQTGWAKEFAIEVLPPLTQEELDNLATAQLAAGSVERETFEA